MKKFKKKLQKIETQEGAKFGDTLGPDYVMAPRDETERKTLDVPLRFKPGEQFGYSNAGYRIDAANDTKIGFKMNDKGSVVGLTVPGKQDFIALREK